MRDCWATDDTGVNALQELCKQYEKVLSLVERALHPTLMYEDIYSRIFNIGEDNDNRYITKYKWRRLSIWIDLLLLLSYVLSVIYYKRIPATRHVRGSRRSDL